MIQAIALLFAAVLGGAAQAPAPGLAVAGVVQDQTGAVLPGATVDLVTTAGAVAQSTTADGAGAFRFDRVPAGQYQLLARFEGFTPASMRIRVTNRATGAQRLVLAIGVPGAGNHGHQRCSGDRRRGVQ